MAAVFIATNANTQMPRTDTTRETYSKKLLHLLESRTHIQQAHESKLAWVASRRSDIVGESEEGGLFLMWELISVGGIADPEINAALGEICRQDKELTDLDDKIASIQGLLKWFGCESPAPLGAE